MNLKHFHSIFIVTSNSCESHDKGGITGGVQCIITGPMELVKTRMQVTGIGESQTKSSLVRTAAQIYKKNGLLGFTAGFGATLTREIPAFMCYFGSYDMFLKIQNYHPCKFEGHLFFTIDWFIV